MLVLRNHPAGPLVHFLVFYCIARHTADNIEYDWESGDIFAGSIPLPIKALATVKDGGRTKVPGGLEVVRLGDRVEVEDIIVHDGTVLSQVASGLQLGSHVILGSPYAPGVLVCGVDTH